MSEPKPVPGPSAPLDGAPLEALPIFPLPGTVLLPSTPLALHVFEPRYRKMIADALDGSRWIAIATLDPSAEPDVYGRPPVRPVMGAGLVRRAVRLPDGRYNLVIEGRARLEQVEEHRPDPHRPYRVIRARPRLDAPDGDPEALRQSAHALRALCAGLEPRMTESGVETLRELLAEKDPGIFVDRIAGTLVPDHEDRYAILCAPTVDARLRLTTGAVGSLLIDAEELEAMRGAGGWGVGTGEA